MRSFIPQTSEKITVKSTVDGIIKLTELYAGLVLVSAVLVLLWLALVGRLAGVVVAIGGMIAFKRRSIRWYTSIIAGVLLLAFAAIGWWFPYRWVWGGGMLWFVTPGGSTSVSQDGLSPVWLLVRFALAIALPFIFPAIQSALWATDTEIVIPKWREARVADVSPDGVKMPSKKYDPKPARGYGGRNDGDGGLLPPEEVRVRLRGDR